MLETRIVKGVAPESDARRIRREFERLLAEGVRMRPAGDARRDPRMLLRRGYWPKHAIRLFDATYYLTGLREDPSWEGTLRFFVAWVRPHSGCPWIYPRLFSKDYSLVWRSPSHFIRSEHENWMGKGDVRWIRAEGEEFLATFEETTNLPLEIQGALDGLTRRERGRHPRDQRAVGWILRRAPDRRLEPYEDFAAPRRKARSDPRNRIHGGREIARFIRKNDPTSLRFARGFEPDFRRGVLEESRSGSAFYGGCIRKFRILSRNRRIQYQFVAAPRVAWIIPPQALTTEITSYGVRSIDVHAAEDLCVPGFEYDFVDESTGRHHSQVPEGFAGEPSELDPARVDASAWTEALPVIQRFRQQVLGRSRRRAPSRARRTRRRAGRARGSARARSRPRPGLGGSPPRFPGGRRPGAGPDGSRLVSPILGAGEISPRAPITQTPSGFSRTIGPCVWGIPTSAAGPSWGGET